MTAAARSRPPAPGRWASVRQAWRSLQGRWRTPLRLVEIVVFAATVPLLWLLSGPAADGGAWAGFSWVALGPVVLAARYGVARGAACALLAIAIAAVLGAPGIAVLSVGTLVLTTLVGDATSGWRRRALLAEAQNGYLRHRLQEFSNDYHVLTLSHGQLEAFVVGQRLSLRCALQRLRPALATRDASVEAGEELMAVFAQFCSVQVAGLYTMKSETVVDSSPLAVLGDMGELPAFDPLLRLAVSGRQLVSVKPDAPAGNRHESALLAVVPIVDSRDRLHAVLVIRDMHFMAFQQQNLDTLALLSGYIGDRIAHTGSLDEGPAEHFLTELDTALRFVATHGVQAMLLSLRLKPHPLRDRIADRLSEDIRRLDCAWRLPPRVGGRTGPAGSDDDGSESDGGCTIAVLLPLAGRAGANAWLDRVAAGVHERWQVDLQALIGSARCLALDARHDRRAALAFLIGEPGSAGEPLIAEQLDRAA